MNACEHRRLHFSHDLLNAKKPPEGGFQKISKSLFTSESLHRMPRQLLPSQLHLTLGEGEQILRFHDQSFLVFWPLLLTQ
jgi:hypothetical protein